MMWFEIDVRSSSYEGFFEVCAHDVLEALKMMKDCFGICEDEINGIRQVEM